MTTKTLTRTEEPATVENHPVQTCAHHWLIEPPEAPTSKGVCKICGAEREFVNYEL